MNGSNTRRAVALAPLLWAAAGLNGQTITNLVTFQGPNGIRPEAPLAQGADGNFYGTTYGSKDGGTFYPGTIFKMTPDGTLTTLANLGKDYATAGLLQATNGDFYGATTQGGNRYHAGTVFKMTPEGTITTLYTACSGNGCARPGGEPLATPIQATDGEIYGTFNAGPGGYGEVYKMPLSGNLKPLVIFNGADGFFPWGAGVIQASDGNFYGVTEFGGIPCPFEAVGGCGIIYRVTPGGDLTVMYNFCSQPDCVDGALPFGNGLVQASDGNLYGTTSVGGDPTLCYNQGCGTIYRLGLDGTFTTIHIMGSGENSLYCACYPQSAMIQATDGNLYGTAGFVAYQATLDGTVTSYDVGDITQYAPLIQATDGNFYGTAVGDERPTGTGGKVFKLSMGLAPFVKTLLTAGKAGSKVTILGNNLTGTTGVTFNGTPAASFTVNTTGSAITTHVPTGATSGFIQVAAPGGILISNVPFEVTQ